jgi:hypothetical protein
MAFRTTSVTVHGRLLWSAAVFQTGFPTNGVHLRPSAAPRGRAGWNPARGCARQARTEELRIGRAVTVDYFAELLSRTAARSKWTRKSYYQTCKHPAVTPDSAVYVRRCQDGFRAIVHLLGVMRTRARVRVFKSNERARSWF